MYISLYSYCNAKKDTVFKWIESPQIRSAIKAIHSVGADGNCGFRSVSYDVYNDQCKWDQVKEDMLETYMKYKDTLYKVIGSDAVTQFEEERMVNRLLSRKSPCLERDDQATWFSTFICPQVVADTYNRPVIVFSYIENRSNTGKLINTYEACVYFPLINMELIAANNPISILAAQSHFYYIEFTRTPKGRMKKFPYPSINIDHHRLRNEYPTICSNTDYSVLYY